MPRPNIVTGHAPGHLREAFCEMIETQASWSSPEFQRLAGRLWNCTDILPGWHCHEIDMPDGSTYAQAARHLRQRH